MSAPVLIEAVESEGFGGGCMVVPAFGDVEVAGVFARLDSVRIRVAVDGAGASLVQRLTAWAADAGFSGR